MIGVGLGPTILSPGRGPNGPGPIDMRRPISGVGWGSSVPYGPTCGYAAGNTGVTGYVGPAADSLRRPTTYYVRVGGSNNNGGTGTSLTAERSGSDGVVVGGGSLAFTSATGAFTAADVGKGLCVNTGTSSQHYRIVSINSSTSVNLDRPGATPLSSQTWALGGAWADIRAPLGDIAVRANVVGAASACNSGDTVYVGGGTYRHVLAVSTATWGSTLSGIGLNAGYPQFNGRLNIIGDVDGSKTGDAGPVRITAYTTDDKTAPSATVFLNFQQRGNIAFSNILWVSGSVALMQSVQSALTQAQNVTFTDCAFVWGGLMNQTASITCTYGQYMNWLFDRCYFGPTSNTSALAFTLNSGNGPDYDANIVFQNTLFFGSGAGRTLNVVKGLALTGLGGGVKSNGNTALACGTYLLIAALASSLVFPCTVYSSVLQCNTTALNAGTLGQIVDGNCLFLTGTARNNGVTVGGSISSGAYAPLFHFGQERIWGGFKRWLGEPMAGSPLLGFVGPTGTGFDSPTLAVDLARRQRPAGSASPLAAVGALERHNTWVKNTGTVRSGTNSLSITGPGDQEWLIPVDTSTVTISAYLRYTAYSGLGGLLPALQIDANPAIGVPAQTVFSTVAGLDAWELVSLSPITPTGKGIVTVRVVSFDSGAGTAFADDFAVA